MNKFQVVFYDSEGGRYSYFIKVPNMGDIPAESYLAVDVLTQRILKLGIEIYEINCRKIK